MTGCSRPFDCGLMLCNHNHSVRAVLRPVTEFGCNYGESGSVTSFFTGLQLDFKTLIMIGMLDSSVPPLKLFTMLPLAHTIHSPSSCTPCTSGMLSCYANHLYCVRALAGVSVDFHT